MVETLRNRLHILTLVVKNRRDIPLVRSKAGLLAELCNMKRTDRVKIAVTASEGARYLLEHSGGGTVSFLLVCCGKSCPGGDECAGIMLELKGRRITRHASNGSKDNSFSKHPAPLETRMPFAGIKKVIDIINVISDGRLEPVRLELVKWGAGKPWKELAESDEFLRKRLFRNAEESFVANLKAKHEEVLKLLEELSHKNRELDRANSDLMQLSNDLEILTYERTMSEIALKVADRIRNPVTAIGGLARMLIKKEAGDSRLKKKLEAIFNEARKLEEIVRDFDSLAMAKSKSFQKLDLRQVTRSVLETLKPTLQQKEIRLDFKVTDDEVIALLNPQTIKVALLHILRNAIEASPRGGIIEVKVWRRDGRPFVSVRDFGPGISDDVGSKLFRTTVTTKATGTGMGLITVKQIMDEHKGSVEIKTGKELGAGTEVTLLFPVRWSE